MPAAGGGCPSNQKLCLIGWTAMSAKGIEMAGMSAKGIEMAQDDIQRPPTKKPCRSRAFNYIYIHCWNSHSIAATQL